MVASALNFVILVASLSVYNSGVYSNSRMLFGLSVQGNAPKFLARVSKRGVPVNSLLLSGRHYLAGGGAQLSAAA